MTGQQIIGNSGPTGTAAVTLNNSGLIVIATGGLLVLRGDITYSGGLTNTNDAVVIQPGGVLEFDSSNASRPAAHAGASTHYAFRQISEHGLRTFRATGTVGSHAIVRSNPAGGAGMFTQDQYIAPVGIDARFRILA